MSIYRLTKNAITPLQEVTYAERGVKERPDLQRLLKANIGIVAPDVLVISQEFDRWEDSKRRIDLLGIDSDAKLVVIELKRDEEGGHMDLQAIRYAAMVSRTSFQKAVEIYQTYIDKSGAGGDARDKILNFLHQSEPPQDDAILEVRIVLVAADFAKELTTAVLWLNEWELDIRCVKIKPYGDGDGTILEVQRLVPLPEAAEYQTSIREEAINRREVARESGEPTGYIFMNTGEGSNNGRSWDDCYDYGYVIAGGGNEWQNHVRTLKVGDKVCAYLKGRGYVGIGEVIAEAVPEKDFVPQGQIKRLVDLPMKVNPQSDRLNDETKCDWCASVRWIYKLERNRAVLKHRFRRGTLQAIKQQSLVDELLAAFKAATEGK